MDIVLLPVSAPMNIPRQRGASKKQQVILNRMVSWTQISRAARIAVMFAHSGIFAELVPAHPTAAVGKFGQFDPRLGVYDGFLNPKKAKLKKSNKKPSSSSSGVTGESEAPFLTATDIGDTLDVLHTALLVRYI